MIGIYSIINNVNNKRYIGKSVNILKRWKLHIYHLKNKEHHNIHLQRAWDNYKEDNFTFEVNEICEIDMLNKCEDKWCKLFNVHNSKCGYNLRFTGLDNRNSHCKESRDKIAKAFMKEILMMDKNGNIIESFQSAKEVSLIIGCTEAMVSLAVTGKSNICKGYVLIHKDKYDSSKDYTYKRKNINSRKKIICINLNTKEEIEFDSVTEASEKLNIYYTNIIRVLKGKRTKHKLYTFKYKEWK